MTSSTITTTKNTKKSSSGITSTKGIAIGILIVILIIVVVYVIVMFELFKQEKFIFAPYTPPTPPGPHFYPLGSVTPLTQEEIDQRNAIIAASFTAA